MFKQHGADIIDVSAGQTSRWANPVYGRMFQTPFSEMVRNEVRIPTIAVGNITTADQVNTIIAAGRADLCALGAAASDQSAIHAHRFRRIRIRAAILAASLSVGEGPGVPPVRSVSRPKLQALRQAARPSSHDQRRQVQQAAE